MSQAHPAADMLVKLYTVERDAALEERLRAQGIDIKRPIAPDTQRILQFVRDNFGDGWANECAVALGRTPSSCFIAVRRGQEGAANQLVGFACFDVTMRNFFGPIGVLESMRGYGVGRALLLNCLTQMHADGYAYAIIGWVGDARAFYEKCVDALVIPDSHPGAYANMIHC